MERSNTTTETPTGCAHADRVRPRQPTLRSTLHRPRRDPAAATRSAPELPGAVEMGEQRPVSGCCEVLSPPCGASPRPPPHVLPAFPGVSRHPLPEERQTGANFFVLWSWSGDPPRWGTRETRFPPRPACWQTSGALATKKGLPTPRPGSDRPSCDTRYPDGKLPASRSLTRPFGPPGTGGTRGGRAAPIPDRAQDSPRPDVAHPARLCAGRTAQPHRTLAGAGALVARGWTRAGPGAQQAGRSGQPSAVEPLRAGLSRPPCPRSVC